MLEKGIPCYYALEAPNNFLKSFENKVLISMVL